LNRRRLLASAPLAAWSPRVASAQTLFRFGKAAEGGSFQVYAHAYKEKGLLP
jgi:hypothetical protein